jgi:hypothetical protein
LSEIFPGFRDHWNDKDNPFVQDDGSFGYHAVMLNFNDFLAGVESWSNEQLKRFSEVLNAAVTRDDDLENAVSTCFLEHMHQMKMTKLLNPHLTAQAKRKSRA